MHLIVEGESDERVFRGLIEALVGADTESLGISFSNLEGIGRARLYTRIVRLAKTLTGFPVLVADREGDIERDVKLLKKEGLLSEETAFLWEAKLEEDNFTDEELVTVAAQLAEQKGGTLQLDAAELRAVRQSQKERLGEEAQGLGNPPETRSPPAARLSCALQTGTRRRARAVPARRDGARGGRGSACGAEAAARDCLQHRPRGLTRTLWPVYEVETRKRRRPPSRERPNEHVTPGARDAGLRRRILPI